MPEEKVPRKAAPRKPRNESTVTVKAEPQPYEATSKQLSDLDERVSRIEQALVAALGITL